MENCATLKETFLNREENYERKLNETRAGFG